MTKAFARDGDGDGDIDFVGTGEGYRTGDFGWYEKTVDGYEFHEFDIVDNKNGFARTGELSNMS